MLKLIKFLTAFLLLVWLGATITITFFVGPSLFAGSEAVPNSTVAADIIAPLLHKMDMIGWILLPVAIVLHGAIWKLLGGRAGRAVAVSALMLAAAWGGTLYAGIPLNNELHAIRTEFKESLGGYHLAPADHPARQRFAKLHGLVMVITLANLGLGIGSFFCVTQLFEIKPDPKAAP